MPSVPPWPARSPLLVCPFQAASGFRGYGGYSLPEEVELIPLEATDVDGHAFRRFFGHGPARFLGHGSSAGLAQEIRAKLGSPRRHPWSDSAVAEQVLDQGGDDSGRRGKVRGLPWGRGRFSMYGRGRSTLV